MKLGRHEFARLIAHVACIAANKGKLAPYDIEDIDNIVDFDVPNATPERIYTSCGMVDEMLAAVASNRKIDAIKAYRSITGVGLKEAKDAIEAYWLRQPAPAANATLGDILHNATK